MSKHTPGPWSFRKCQPREIILKRVHWEFGQPNGRGVGIAFGPENGEPSAANARLCAAAPALLEALEQLLTDMVISQGNMRDAAKRDPRWEGCADALQPRVDAARAAIAAAKGDV